MSPNGQRVRHYGLGYGKIVGIAERVSESMRYWGGASMFYFVEFPGVAFKFDPLTPAVVVVRSSDLETIDE